MPGPSDVLQFGLSAGSNFSWGGGGGYLPPRLGYTGGGSRASGEASTPTGAAGAGLGYDLSKGADISKLSEMINTINLNAQKAANQARIPNDPALEAQSSKVIGQELQGEVPQDVQNLLAQQAAERGVATGVGTDSPNANAAYLRALGLTSLGQIQEGQQNLTSAVGRNPVARTFDPSTQLLTPDQAAQLNLGYISEADRTRLEEERLNLEATRGGGGGRSNPYGYGGWTGGTGSSPYQYSEPGMYAYGNPNATTGLTGSSVLPTQQPTTASWLASLGQYSTPADIESGVPLSPMDYSTLGGVQGPGQGTGE